MRLTLAARAILAFGLLPAVAAGIGVAPAVAAPAVTVEWVSASPFTAYAYGAFGTKAQPTFLVHNLTSGQLRVDAVLTMDPPEVLGPEDPPNAGCSVQDASPLGGDTVGGKCSIPITAQQVLDRSIIEASITVKAYDEAGVFVGTATSGVLDVVGVPSPASLSVAIDPIPPAVIVVPAEITIGYDIVNTGTVDFDDVTVEVQIQAARAGTLGRTVCPVDIGALVIGATQHGSCLVSLATADAARHPVSVTVVAHGIAGSLVPTASDRVEVPLVIAGRHLEIDLLEIGLNGTRPSPGDTFVVSVQVYNVGADTLDVTTSVHPASPDCARDLGALEPANATVFQCDVQVPDAAAGCRMPYTVFAHGVTGDEQTTDASIESGADLTQPGDRCGAGGGKLPATDTTAQASPLPPADPTWPLVAILVASLVAPVMEASRRKSM